MKNDQITGRFFVEFLFCWNQFWFAIYIVHVGFLSHFPEVSNQQKTTTTTTTTNNNNNNNSNRDNHPSGRTNIRSQRGSSAARASSPFSIRRWDPTFRRTKGFTVARKEGDARPYPSMGRTVYLSTFKTKKATIHCKFTIVPWYGMGKSVGEIATGERFFAAF